MSENSSRPIRFRDYLPEVLRGDERDAGSFQNRFLQPLEDLFEELQSVIEGVSSGDLRLTVDFVPPRVEGSRKIEIKLSTRPEPAPRFPADTFVTLARGDTDSTTLVEEYPGKTPKSLFVRDADFADSLKSGDEIVLHAGGLPDLFNPDLTPPPQLARRLHLDEYRAESDSTFLNFLASWIGLPLRDDLIPRAGETDLHGQLQIGDPWYERRKARWNRHLMRTAVSIYPRRGTRAGIEGMLKAWLKDDLIEGGVMVTDLRRAHVDVDAVFQLGERATLGVDTVLGEGAPFFFIADLVVDPTVRGLRNPAGIDVFFRQARFILDSETPAHSYYQLRVRATTMQLTPPPGKEVAGEIYAQLGETTLLCGEPSIFTVFDGRHTER